LYIVQNADFIAVMAGPTKCIKGGTLGSVLPRGRLHSSPHAIDYLVASSKLEALLKLLQVNAYGSVKLLFSKENPQKIPDKQHQ
jgi:hypothetical protein